MPSKPHSEFSGVSVEVTPVAWDQAHQKILTSIAGGVRKV